MFSRLKRSALVFVVALAAYCLYALIAVPLIEPSAKVTKSKRTASRPPTRVRKLDHLFPAGSWELGRPIVVETNQGTLLLDEYHPLPEGHLKLERCTLICYTDQVPGQSKSDAGEDTGRRPIVLRASEGATLRFDRPLNVLRGEIGRLVGGRLEGEITITSPPSAADREDGFEIVTRNVQLDAQRIWTPHEVRFRYGPNLGRGSDLTIHLSNAPKKEGGEPTLGVGGVKALELVHLERLELQLNDSGLFGAPAKGQAGNGKKAQAHAATQQSSLHVTCRGPLRFDFSQQVISLEDQVELMRHNQNGPSDQLLCQLMEIHFTQVAREPRSENAAAQPKDTGTPGGKLTPSKVVAVGYPVIIRAASVGIGTRAERVEYDCILKRVWLKDREKVMFQDRQRDIEARELRYSLGENGRVGDLSATGPGFARAKVGTPPRDMEITWQGNVEVRRVEGHPVLSFTSQAKVTVKDTATFSADTLHLYLSEVPKPDNPEKFALQPDRLHAIGNVVLESPDLSGRLQEAKLWFRVSSGGSHEHPVKPGSTGLLGMAGGENSGDLFGDPADGAKRPQHKFRLQARSIEALVILAEQPVIDRLALRDRVEIREVTAGEQQPVVVRGDLFELQDGASQHPCGALLGQPAEVIARGLVVHGQRFHLYPADNLLDIVGAGDMVLPAKVAVDAATPLRQPAKIQWKDKMQFDGQTARFVGDVSLNVSQQQRDGHMRAVALGDSLRVQLTQRIEFQDPQVQGEADLAHTEFEGWGFFEMEMFDLNGERKLTEQMQVRQLAIDHVTGAIVGAGPGWLRGIHRGRDVLKKDQPASLPQSPSGLNFLRVDFVQTLAGNLHHRQLEFLDGTKTLYGPVQSWDQALDEIPQADLPAQAVVLTCDRLAVAQMDQENDEHVELEATGNAFVEGRSFSASGGRISYARAKDQLVLERDARNYATLAFQKQVGAAPSHLSADKILFWPSTRQAQVVNLRPSEILDIGQFRSDSMNR